jgi:hypothetical protein
MNKPYREMEWMSAASGPTEESLSSWVEDYKRGGYATDLRHEDGIVRLYVRMEVPNV